MVSLTSEEIDQVVSVAKEAAEAGSELLRQAYRERAADSTVLSADNKSSDSDWVTQYDLAVEKVVRGTILSARPTDQVTGEELPDSEVTAHGSGIRWSIDPIDGTTNFIREIAAHAVSVAAVYEGQWVAGAVYAPALGRRYWAGFGVGAWVDSGAGVRRLTGPESSRRGKIVGTGFSYEEAMRRKQIAVLPEILAYFGDIRRIGSASLDLCFVADGTLDAYYEQNLGEYDWAAGALIAQEAGAQVLRPQERMPGHGQYLIAAEPESFEVLNRLLLTGQ